MDSHPSFLINYTHKPVCRDFLKGKCSRVNCKYQHITTVLKRPHPSDVDNNQPMPLTGSPTKHHQSVRNILSQLFVPNKGNLFISINQFITQKTYNGIFAVNLSDIIPDLVITNLMNIYCLSALPMKSQIIHERMGLMLANNVDEWATKIRSVLKWSRMTTPDFDKSNYSTIFVFNIADKASDWMVKHGIKMGNIQLREALLFCCNFLLTCLFAKIPDLSNELNLVISYLHDELNMLNKGLMETLVNMIMIGNNINYLGSRFLYNMYYIGAMPDFTKPMRHPINHGFTFSTINYIKSIDINDILQSSISSNNHDNDSTSVDASEYNDINDLIVEFNNNIIAHNTKLYQVISEKNMDCKSALTNTISQTVTGKKGLVIIGCNLDMEFDKQILRGLKEIVGCIDFNNTTRTPSGKPTTNGKGESCEIVSSMSVIMPIFGSGNSNNSGSPVVNEIMKEIMGSLTSGGNSKTANTTQGPNKVINKLFTIGLGLISGPNNKISLNQPFDTINGIDKIKEFGAEPSGKVIILLSASMNHEFFKEFIRQITNTPGYPNKINATFLRFDINPSIRKCLAYYNYRQNMLKYLAIQIPRAIPLIQMSKQWYKFMNTYLSALDSSQPEDIDSVHSNTSNNTDKVENPEKNEKCCNCCSCLSRNGIGYQKFGYIPYIPTDAFKEIADDSWLPRF